MSYDAAGRMCEIWRPEDDENGQWVLLCGEVETGRVVKEGGGG